MRFYSKLKKRGGKNFSLIAYVPTVVSAAYKIINNNLLTLDIFVKEDVSKEFSNKVRKEDRSLIITVPGNLVKKYKLKQNKIYEFQFNRVRII